MKIYTLILIMLLLSFSVHATYTETGTYETDFVLGTGFWNSDFDDTQRSYKARTLSDPKLTPLIANIDNVTGNEIVVLDGSTIKIFEGDQDLGIADSINLQDTGRHSPMILYNIDGDDYTEIIIHLDESEEMYIYEYNGSILKEEYNFSTADKTTTEGDEGESLIKCITTDRCVIVYSKSVQSAGGGVKDYMFARTFTSSGWDAPEEQIDETAATDNHVFCMPRIPTISYTPWFAGQDNYIVWSYIDVAVDALDKVVIAYLNVNATGNITTFGAFNTASQELITTPGLNCIDDEVGLIFTAAYVENINGADGDGYEVVFARQNTALAGDEFKMYSYYNNGVQLDDYPEVFYGNGYIMSNVFKMNAFPDTDDDDFCVLGYEDLVNRIVLLCASEISGGFGPFNTDNFEFKYSPLAYANLSRNHSVYNIVNHATKQSTETQTVEGNTANLDEIVNSYGIFSLDWSSCSFGIIDDDCDLVLEYDNPEPDAVVLTYDVEQVGRTDLITLSTTRLAYWDDGYSNTGAYIDEYTVDPCIDSTWQVNGSVEITIKVGDVDGDNVAARAILYYGDANEQDSGWTNNATAGYNFIFNHQINKTIGTGTLRLMGRDVFDPTDTDILDLTFSVGTSGVVFGDCITSVDVDNSNITGSGEDTDAAAAAEALQDLPEQFLPEDAVPSTYYPLVSLLIILLMVGGSIFVASQNGIKQGTALGVIGGVAGLLTWLGLILMGMIGAWTLIVTIILAVAVIALVLFMKTGG